MRYLKKSLQGLLLSSSLLVPGISLSNSSFGAENQASQQYTYYCQSCRAYHTAKRSYKYKTNDNDDLSSQIQKSVAQNVVGDVSQGYGFNVARNLKREETGMDIVILLLYGLTKLDEMKNEAINKPNPVNKENKSLIQQNKPNSYSPPVPEK